MGANLVVLAGTLLLYSFQHDTAAITEQPSHGGKLRFDLVVLLLSLVAGCRPASQQTQRAGHFDVEWTGSDSGKISGPATAEWCAPRRILEIRTVQGDTGIALALYPTDTLAAGSYRVVEPQKAESVPPAVALALRWLTQNAVQGFQGDSGTVDLERSKAGRLSGKVTARARSVVDAQRVTIRGTFRGLTPGPESRGCTAPLGHPQEDAEPGDTGVH